MNFFVNVLALIFLFQNVKGQDTIRHLEFGSTLVNLNPNRSHPIEFVNGLFFRYTQKRLALRVQSSYARYSVHFSGPTVNCQNCARGGSNNNLFRLALGGQFFLIKNKEFIYGFCDLGFRRRVSTGGIYDNISDYHFIFSENGLDAFMGLGFKIKFLKNIYITPELACNFMFYKENRTRTNIISKQVIESDFYHWTLNPNGKLHLTMMF